MDLFLSNSHESFLLELLCHFLKLDETRKINPLILSPASAKLYEEGGLKLPGLPCLIDNEGRVLNTAAAISVYLIEIAYCEGILLKNASETLAIFEIVQRKKQDEVLKLADDQLLTRSFYLGNHLTLADLVLFAYLYPIMFVMNDSTKLKFSNVLRWYLHIQNLTDVSRFLSKKNKGFIELPENLEGIKKK